MKKHDVRKLAFNKQTVRQLSTSDLQLVNGGDGSVCMSISESVCLSGPCAPKMK